MTFAFIVSIALSCFATIIIWSEIEDKFLCTMLTVTILGLWFIGLLIGSNIMIQSAIEHNAAKYIVNEKTGESTFVWNDQISKGVQK